MRSKSGRGIFGWLLLFVAAAPTLALPPNFFDESIADDWNQAVGIAFGPDDHIFVWEKAGRVWIVENGVKSATPLIDISEEVGDWRDFGLLGFALDPDFETNGYIYLLYVVDYHHLLYFGTPNYDPAQDWYFQDTIGRVTRYTCNPDHHSVNYASRLVLLGESINTGIPVCHQSHGVGSLVFGVDGTLLVSCGDGASFEDVDSGGCMGGSSCTCLSDGIIADKEDVGAFRSQLVDSLSGKILRLDPATGNGVPSNPFYNAGAPRSARSRVWAMGLRNPYRFTLRPGTGNPDPTAGSPGTIYLGDVGWRTWEEMSVVKTGGKNLGWPIYEGMDADPEYSVLNIANEDALNPLFGTNQPGFGTCNQRYFYFRNLLTQDTLSTPFFANPCNTNIAIPANIPKFVHKRPPFDWVHGGPQSRTSTYEGNDSVVYDVNDPASPVQGGIWGGNCSTGGTWYTGTDFPIEYQNSYYHADFGAGWIRQFLFDANDNPVEVRNFLEDASAAIVAVVTPPNGGGIYYIGYDQDGCCMVRRITWLNNLPPTAVAAGSPLYGPAPLSVQFSSAGSSDSDPVGGGGLSYAWNFGDGSAIDSAANPTHLFQGNLDITAQGTFVARVFSLNPPHPVGGGSWDPEVMRDGDFPPVGNDESSRQFDTYHGGDQGNNDWIGYTFTSPNQISKVVFQEGKEFFDGGWFDTFTVQSRNGNVWTNVPGVTISPPYAGANGSNYETYELTFPTVTTNGIRIQGTPGGSANFISVGELRVLTPTNAGPQRFDVTLTVTDSLNSPASAGLVVSLNNTPPSVVITSPLNNSHWPSDGAPVPLTALISDAEHGPSELTCRWQSILHHNDHVHPEPYDFNCTSSAVFTPINHEGETFFYEVQLQVTDAHGLSTTTSSFVYPPSTDPIPAVPTWGLIVLFLGIAIAGTCISRRAAAA